MKSPVNVEAVDTSWCWTAEVPIELKDEFLVAAADWKLHHNYRPLKENTALFLEFARTRPKESEILAFANRYGLLGIYYNHLEELLPEEPFFRERLGYWKEAIGQMRRAVQLWYAIQDGPRGPIGPNGVALDLLKAWPSVLFDSPDDHPPTRDEVVQICRKKLCTHVNTALQSYATKAEIAPTPNGDFLLVFKPETLIAAMWLQLAQTIAGNYTIKICRGCGKPFQAGAGTKRRADALTCDDSCRQRAHRKEIEDPRAKGHKSK